MRMPEYGQRRRRRWKRKARRKGTSFEELRELFCLKNVLYLFYTHIHK
jgi:hypothetical protein